MKQLYKSGQKFWKEHVKRHRWVEEHYDASVEKAAAELMRGTRKTKLVLKVQKAESCG